MSGISEHFWVGSLLVGAGFSLILGSVYFSAFWRLSRSKENLWLGSFGLAAAAMAISEAWLYSSRSAAEYCLAGRWAIGFSILAIAPLVLYAAEFVGGLRRTARLVAGCAVAVAVATALASCGYYSELASFERISLPWGERLASGGGPLSTIGYAGYVVCGGAMAMLAAACLKALRTRTRFEFAMLAGAMVLIFGAGGPHAFLIDAGIIESPYLYSPAVILTMLAFSSHTGERVATASRLTTTIAARESRWRALHDHAELLIAQVGPDGRIEDVNPFLLATTGYTEEEVLGRDFRDLIVEEERTAVSAAFADLARAPRGKAREVKVLRKDGAKRSVVWRSVGLFDEAGGPAGVLSVGSDVTERSLAESARDAALEQVEELLAQAEEENLYLKEEIERRAGFEDIVGESPAIAKVLDRVGKVAPLDTTVLIQGETGVGKELIARAIHDHSGRRKGAFVKLNCAALVPSLAESELFGHEAGAFTGAHAARKGRFEIAHRGTLFLDEVGELPLELQAKLLRVLQAGEFERVGASGSSRADVRILAASNRDLEAEVETGRFRADLFFRLNVYPMTVPPLRERPGDIALLARYYAPRIAERLGRSIDEIPAGVMRQLERYDWPGNVRELLNVLERALVTSNGTRLRLASALRSGNGNGNGKPAGVGVGTPLAEVERSHIMETLLSTDWRISGPRGAAQLLDLHPSTLRGRMRKLGIRRSTLPS